MYLGGTSEAPEEPPELRSSHDLTMIASYAIGTYKI